MMTSSLQVLFVCVFFQALAGIQGTTTPTTTSTETATTTVTSTISTSASSSASAGASAGGSSSDSTSPAATTTTGTTTTTTLAPLKCYSFSNCNSASSCGTTTVNCDIRSCQITRITTGGSVNITASCSLYDCSATTTTATTMTTTTATTTTTTSASSTTTTAATTTEYKCCSDTDNCNSVSFLNTAPDLLPGYLSLILAAGYSLLRMM